MSRPPVAPPDVVEEAQPGPSGRSAAPKSAALESDAPVRFRNYRPREDTLKAAQVAVANPPPPPVPSPAVRPDTLDPTAALAAAVSRGPAWDLKRDLSPQRRRLEARTNRAIFELATRPGGAGAPAGGPQGQGERGKTPGGVGQGVGGGRAPSRDPRRPRAAPPRPPPLSALLTPPTRRLMPAAPALRGRRGFRIDARDRGPPTSRRPRAGAARVARRPWRGSTSSPPPHFSLPSPPPPPPSRSPPGSCSCSCDV